MRIEWQAIAEEDLAEWLVYIAQDNSAAAYQVHEEIIAQTAGLAEYPRLGRAGRVRGTRELVILRTPYIAAYRITTKAITIIRILHGSRRWPKEL